MTSETTTQDTAQDSAKLSVSDLQQLAVIVDVAFRKGVFNAEEAAPVSALYAKLVGFLRQFNTSQTAESESSQTATESKD